MPISRKERMEFGKDPKKTLEIIDKLDPTIKEAALEMLKGYNDSNPVMNTLIEGAVEAISTPVSNIPVEGVIAVPTGSSDGSKYVNGDKSSSAASIVADHISKLFGSTML